MFVLQCLYIQSTRFRRKCRTPRKRTRKKSGFRCGFTAVLYKLRDVERAPQREIIRPCIAARHQSAAVSPRSNQDSARHTTKASQSHTTHNQSISVTRKVATQHVQYRDRALSPVLYTALYVGQRCRRQHAYACRGARCVQARRSLARRASPAEPLEVRQRHPGRDVAGTSAWHKAHVDAPELASARPSASQHPRPSSATVAAARRAGGVVVTTALTAGLPCS